jgi:GntR family transcriptional repressor for pyruvate dehydrogenase complex
MGTVLESQGTIASRYSDSVCDSIPVSWIAMRPLEGTIKKEKLSDSLARAVKRLIDSGGYQVGDRLPTISDMAGMFEVGAPTLREGLKKLQAAGIIHIKHGSGIFVAENRDSLFVHNPVAERTPSRKMVLDMLEARIAVEPFAAALAADHATREQILSLTEILHEARRAIDRGSETDLAEANLAFHRQVAVASNNHVLSQLLPLITGFFQPELNKVFEVYGSTEQDFAEHREILSAIRRKNSSLASKRMRNHLESISVALTSYYDQLNTQPLH